MKIRNNLMKMCIKSFMFLALCHLNIVHAQHAQYYYEDWEPRPGEVDPVSDDAVRVLMIKDSVASFGKGCPCPYSENGFGGQCGTNSYYYKPGGRRLYCYLSDIPTRLVVFYRQKNGYHTSLFPESSVQFSTSTSSSTVSTTTSSGTTTSTSNTTKNTIQNSGANNTTQSTSTTQTVTQGGAKNGPEEPTKSFITNYQKNAAPDWNKVLTTK